jgi:hypothetical protein
MKISRTCKAPPPYIPDSGYIESFNARLRDELLDGEIVYSLREAAFSLSCESSESYAFVLLSPHSATSRSA